MFSHGFSSAFAIFSYGASLVTLYRLFAFLYPLKELIVASNQQSLWRIALVSLLFVMQHSLMASAAWKRFWSASVFARAQRSAYVLCSSVLLETLMRFWLSSPTIVWNFDSAFIASVSRIVYFSSVALIIYQSFALDHFEMFGIKQTFFGEYHLPFIKVFRNFESSQLRHPIFLPVVVLLFAVPRMTFDRLLLALGVAAYLLIRNDVTPAKYNGPL